MAFLYELDIKLLESQQEALASFGRRLHAVPLDLSEGGVGLGTYVSASFRNVTLSGVCTGTSASGSPSNVLADGSAAVL